MFYECQLLKPGPYLVYFDVTLVRTFSHREHLTLYFAKLNSRQICSKTVSNFCTSAATLCYSVAEHFCPLWARSCLMSHYSHRYPTPPLLTYNL